MAHDPRISKIFYYFEQHTNIESGRTVGRKIGVVQEILCNKYLLTSQAVRDCVIYEPKLIGRSGATHKVEFVFFQPLYVVELSIGKSYTLNEDTGVTVASTTPSKYSAKLAITTKGKKTATTVKQGLVKKIMHENYLFKIVSINEESVRFAVLDIHRPVASIESKRVGAQRFSGSDKLGSGIQTIEKAKQASLVAIDFDLRFNRKLLVQNEEDEERSFKSFVVLGNGVHWTPHDLAILETYVDYTYLATDEAIIRYADYIRQVSVERNVDFFKLFMTYFQGMTKTQPDSFVVNGTDFVVMCPKEAPPLLKAVEAQIKPYNVIVT